MPLTPPADAAIFDFDGVIIDSRPPVRAAAAAALRDHGIGPPPDEMLDRFMGPPTITAFAELLGQPEHARLPRALTDTYHEHYERVYLTETTLIDGVADVLDAITLPLGLATAKQLEFTEPLLTHLGIRSLFAAVCAPTLAMLHERKPQTLRRTIAALGSRSAVMIGDRHYDVDAARANAIRSIAVTWGIGDRAELTSAGADVIVDSPRELLALVNPSR